MKKGIWVRIASEVEEHPLASLYYAGAILVFIATTLIGVAELELFGLAPITARKLTASGIFVLGICGMVALWLRGRRAGRPQTTLILNPMLKALSTSHELLVSKTNRRFIREDRLMALGHAPRFAFQIKATGAPAISVVLRSPGVLHGPVRKRDKILYEVEFPSPLEETDTYDLRLELEIEDPSSSMQPFHAVTTSGLAEFGVIALLLRFPSQQPASVCYEPCAQSTDRSLAPIEDLMPDASGSFKKTITRIEPNEAHIITWRW